MDTGAGQPKNAIVVLLDSLNRHMVGAYGGLEFATPHLDAFAAKSLRFEKHYAGSLPCMPARPDILCGALDFLWKPWGSIELWERPITAYLREAGVTTMLCSDHPHLFETGGENYHTDFTAWQYERGHENDPWKTRPDPSWAGAPRFDAAGNLVPSQAHYENSRGHFRDEEDFPGPRTMAAAAGWVRRSAPAHERFLLFVDEFDPHEPFDTPEEYMRLYDSSWDGPHLIWPPYAVGAVRRGVMNERQARQVRSCYGAKLTMIDHWFGQLVAAIDEAALWDSTAVIVCTDHGHYLGEKDIWGKPAVPVYEPLGHIPMMVRWPGIEPRATDALTTSVDIFATLCDLFGVRPEHRTHGVSLLPIITGAATSVRDWALMGVWGREVQLVDAEHKYARAPHSGNFPLSMWSNRWSSMPVTHVDPSYRFPVPDDRAWLDRMPGSRIPVIRQPFVAGDFVPYWAATRFSGNHVYRLADDPHEEGNLAGTPSEREMAERMRQALIAVEAARRPVPAAGARVVQAKVIDRGSSGRMRRHSIVLMAEDRARRATKASGTSTEVNVLRRHTIRAWERLEVTVHDVTPEQANWWPAGTANSIAATYLHVVINADVELSRLIHGRAPLVECEWHSDVGQGFPYDPERFDRWVRHITMDWSALRRYGRAVHAKMLDDLQRLSPAELNLAVDMTRAGLGIWDGRELYELHGIWHPYIHLGEIAVLKGLQGSQGWQESAEFRAAVAVEDRGPPRGP